MPIYNVHLLSPMLTWDEVEAENETEAINKCFIDHRIDLGGGPFYYNVEEVEEEE